MEILELLSSMPGFGEFGYFFVKMLCFKEGMMPSNGTVVTILPKENYIVRWDLPYGNSITVSPAVLKRWSHTNNE